jgi:hypothetical protein
VRFEFESGTFRIVLPLSLFHVENRICLSRDVQVTGVIWWAVMMIISRSRRHGVEDWGWSSTGQILNGQMIERSGDTVCGLHCARGDVERGFIG